MPEEPPHLVQLQKACPRCQCNNLKFLFYNNRSAYQPRYKCLGCLKDFTLGGRIRDANPQQAQQHQIGRVKVQGNSTIGPEVGASDGRGEISRTDHNAVEGGVSLIDRPAPKTTGVSENLDHNSFPPEPEMVEVEVKQVSRAIVFPSECARGMVEVEVQAKSGPIAKPVAIPRYGDEVIVEGASKIWVKAVLGSAPYDLARVRERSPENAGSTYQHGRSCQWIALRSFFDAQVLLLTKLFTC